MRPRTSFAPSRRRSAGAAVVLAAVLTVSACNSGSDASRGGSRAAPLPGACELVTSSEVETALGVPISGGTAQDADRCRYVAERGDEAEITVDRPGFGEALDSYRRLNPDAEQVEGVGEEAALRMGNGVGELTFVKGPARFFIIVSSRSITRDALLSLARGAAGRI